MKPSRISFCDFVIGFAVFFSLMIIFGISLMVASEIRLNKIKEIQKIELRQKLFKVTVKERECTQ